MTKRKPRYIPFGMALTYCYDLGEIPLTRRVIKGWHYFYHRRKKVFNCNPTFSKRWFRKVDPNEQA